MKIILFGLILGFLALGMDTRPALAATATASISVTVTVVSGCQVTAPTAVFGSNASTQVAPSSVSVTCTNPTAYNVSLRAGEATSDSTNPATSARKTTGSVTAGHRLLPELAQNVNWGRWADKGFVAEIGGGSTQPYAVYNQTVGAQSFSSGPDADLMVVTVTY